MGQKLSSARINTVGIIGMGYVGSAFYDYIQNHYHVVTYDKYKDAVYPEELDQCDLVVVCVPTPSHADGSCDTTIVEEVVSQLSNPLILIKSTVSPGTTERLARETGKHICFSPEYVGESRYYNPYYKTMAETPFVIVGSSPEVRHKMIEFFEEIGGPVVQYYQCTALEAELIKYMENSFFATKITFVNEFYEIAESFGADWHAVREGWLLDERVGKMHTSVFKHKRGFSGKCLPKDSLAIVRAAQEVGYEPELMKAMIERNMAFTQRDRGIDHSTSVRLPTASKRLSVT